MRWPTPQTVKNLAAIAHAPNYAFERADIAVLTR